MLAPGNWVGSNGLVRWRGEIQYESLYGRRGCRRFSLLYLIGVGKVGIVSVFVAPQGYVASLAYFFFFSHDDCKFSQLSPVVGKVGRRQSV